MASKRYYDIIDIHTHILNNVDDGSESIEETLDLFDEAERIGVKEIILTPHYYKGLYTEKNEVVLEKYSKLLELLEENNIDVKAHIGREIYMLPDISEEIIAGNIMPLANSKYVLLETSFEVRQLYLENEFYNLIENGYIPIFAHVERYGFVQKNPDILDNFINMGVQIQCNYGSILGLYGKKAQKVVKKLLKEEKVDYMASDVHSHHSIYQYVPEAIEKMEKLVSDYYLEQIIYYNAKNIIEE